MNIQETISQNGIVQWIFDLEDQRVNILTSTVMKELKERLDSLQLKIANKKAKALIISSAKPGVFIAGADISEIKSLTDPRDAEEKAKVGQDLLFELENLSIPSLAVIDGACLGGGLELALACGSRIATDSPKTKLGLPETSLGFIPGFGGTQRLPALIGIIQASILISSGKPVDGKKAAKVGLVDRMVPLGYLNFALDQWKEDILKKGYPQRLLKTSRRHSLKKFFSDSFFLTRAMVFSSIKKEIRKKTKNHYPAPLKAVEVIEKTRVGNKKRAYELERKEFARLTVSKTSKYLTDLFFSTEQQKKHPYLDGGKDGLDSISRTAVLGAGVMGGKIAWLLSKKDYPTTMKDISWDAVHKGYKSAHETYGQLEKLGKISPRESNLKKQLIQGSLNTRDIKHSDFIIEAVAEKMSIKKSVLKEISEEVSEEAILVSNTSSLSIDELSKDIRKPERFAGMHFFNPVNRMPLVEVISGEKTSAKTRAIVAAFALHLGKTPVFVKNCPGFLVNRILVPYLLESMEMVLEGYSFRKIDAVVEQFGMPMGPFRLLDEIGFDIGYHVAQVLHKGYGDRMLIPESLKELVEDSGFLGKKGGAGFYLYSKKKGSKDVNPSLESRFKSRKPRITLDSLETEIIYRTIGTMALEALRALDDKIVESERELDLAMIMGTGFPPFKGGLMAWVHNGGKELFLQEMKKLEDVRGPRFAYPN